MSMFVGILTKLFIGFLGLVIVMRMIGKKALSDITPFDIIYSIVLGGIVEESIYDDEVHIGHVLFALLVWGVVIYSVESLLQRRDSVIRKMKGQPSVLIYKGKLNLQEIKDNHIEMEQLRSMLRSQGCFSLKEVNYAMMEINGQVTIKKKVDQESFFSYLLVDEGVAEDDTLKTIGKNKKWLYHKLIEQDYPDIEELVYVEWSEEEGFFVKTYADCYNGQLSIDG